MSDDLISYPDDESSDEAPGCCPRCGDNAPVEPRPPRLGSRGRATVRCQCGWVGTVEDLVACPEPAEDRVAAIRQVIVCMMLAVIVLGGFVALAAWIGGPTK